MPNLNETHEKHETKYQKDIFDQEMVCCKNMNHYNWFRHFCVLVTSTDDLLSSNLLQDLSKNAMSRDFKGDKIGKEHFTFVSNLRLFQLSTMTVRLWDKTSETPQSPARQMQKVLT